MTGPYFRGPDGAKHFYAGLAEAIKYKAPQLRGAHIFKQLDALDMLEDFADGTTPFGLPYTFSAYEMETHREH